MEDILATYDLRVLVRILVVTDGAINLWDTPIEPPPQAKNAGFTLREAARALWDAPAAVYPHTRFVIDHAIHGRGAFTQTQRKETDPETGQARSWTQYDNFQFGLPQFRLSNYDQVWFLGFWPGNPQPDGTFTTPQHRMPLGEGELRALARWMNAGGGVFATGDHGLLGMHLAGDVPRVRAMRRWHHRGLSDDVPSVNQVDRIDTTVPVRVVNGRPKVAFDDQSDNVPKRLALKWYNLWDGLVSTLDTPAASWRSAPHPILCSPLGAIEILPDHMHEGMVREEDEIKPVGKDQSGADEFPGGSHGPRPEVIARMTVRGGNVVYDNLEGAAGSTSVIHRDLPAISVFDGQRAGIGRVVVDSSWHNFLDINVRGTGASAAGATGLLGRNLDLFHYYVRNIAQWLASADKREAMRYGLFFHAVASTGGWSELMHERLLIGARAYDVLGQVASECERINIIFEPWWDVLRFADAMGSMKTGMLALPSREKVSHHILGAMTEAVFEVMPELERLSGGRRGKRGDLGCAVKALVSRLREARRDGVQSLTADWRESLRSTAALLDAIEASAADPAGGTCRS